jgi:hypothetical protein
MAAAWVGVHPVLAGVLLFGLTGLTCLTGLFGSRNGLCCSREQLSDQSIWHIIRWHQASYLCLLGVCLADVGAAGALPCTLLR